MSSEIFKLRFKGLKNGFIEGNKETVFRSGFAVDRSTFEALGGKYVDTWTRVGDFSSGQELVQLGDEKFEDVYGGSVVNDQEVLDRLGITKKVVLGQLKEFLLDLGESLRGSQRNGPLARVDEDGREWSYGYIIEKRAIGFGYCITEEFIECNHQRVFNHHFILPDPLAR